MLVSVLRAVVLGAILMAVTAVRAEYQVNFFANLTFEMADGVILRGDAYVPVPKVAGETFPVLVFPNSWGMPQFEYILKALAFGEEGFIAVEYETRGWYESGGIIDVCGPLDISDATTVLDRVLVRSDWNVNISKIAFVGISYGAGISLSMAGTDPRLTTAVVLSGWNNLTDAIYPYHTPNLLWGGLLELLAGIVGHQSDKLKDLFTDLLAHKNMSFVLDFAAKRSPGRLLDTMNAWNVPLFISGNFLDRLFQPERMLDFFTTLTTPKMLLLNQGMHAEPEALGLFDVPDNYIWGKAKKWLHHWLKDEHNGIMEEPYLHAEVGGSIFDEEYRTFSSWPSPNATTLQYHFSPRSGFVNHFGGLTAAATNSSIVDVIHYGEDSGISSGIPLVGDALSTVGIAVSADLSLTNTKTSIVFISDPTTQPLTVCGTPTFDVSLIVPTAGDWQIAAFLYEVDDLGVGQLISDTSYTHYQDDTEFTSRFDLRDVMLHSFCRVVDQGKRFAIGFALYSNLYQPANSDPSLEVRIVYDQDAQNMLRLPIQP